MSPPGVRREYGISVREAIALCESVEEVQALGKEVVEHFHNVSQGTKRKWTKALKVKAAELRARRIIRPASGLVVPQGAGRIVIPGR